MTQCQQHAAQQERDEQQHTQEPWAVCTRADLRITQRSTDITVASTCADSSISKKWEANARRIVACVNACKGISTIDLEMDNVLFTDALRERSSLRQQREELAAALHPFAALIAEHHERMPDSQPLFFINSNGFTLGDVRRAVAAISKAKP